MATFIALLRGVNVGKAKRVPMERFRGLLAELGYTDVTTLLNSGNASTAADPSRLLVALTQDDAGLAPLHAIEPLVAKPESFAVGKHAAYLHCVNGIIESKAGKALLGKMGSSATTRNWATTLKLHALASVR
jgi:uncharacterized protein (DUF1697 family)